MTDKTEFEKIGVNTIRPFKKNGRWLFHKDGKNYDMAPAGITDAVLSPLVFGVDRLISLGCKLKGINPEDGFLLLFSQEFFPNADVKFDLKEPKFDGWIYNVEELNLKGSAMPGQAAWICPYLIMYFPEPPKTLYLKIEANNDP